MKRKQTRSMPPELCRKLGVEASFRIPLFPSLTSVQWYLYFQTFYPFRLALTKMKREQVKLAKLANFKPAKRPVKTELGQLGQLFSMCRWDFEDSTAPYKNRRWLGWNLVLPKIKRERVKLANFKHAKTLRKRELDQLDQLGQLFFDVSVGLRRLDRTL